MILSLAKRTPKAGKSSRKSRVVHFHEAEDSDDVIDVSEGDVKDSETDSEREDDPRGIIFYVWESVSPPVSKQVLVGK